jgi:hypothetical protein
MAACSEDPRARYFIDVTQLSVGVTDKVGMKFALGFLAVAALAACSKRVNFCDSDKDCSDPAFPFCDVDGQYAPSGGMTNTCTIVPPDCPVERCGCQPGVTTCVMVLVLS